MLFEPANEREEKGRNQPHSSRFGFMAYGIDVAQLFDARCYFRLLPLPSNIIDG